MQAGSVHGIENVAVGGLGFPATDHLFVDEEFVRQGDDVVDGFGLPAGEAFERMEAAWIRLAIRRRSICTAAKRAHSSRSFSVQLASIGEALWKAEPARRSSS